MPGPNSRSVHHRSRALRGAAALGALLALAPGATFAQSLEPVVSGYVTVTSDYRHRGLSESGGEPSIQVGADYQRAGGFFAGAWAARVDYLQAADDASTRFKIGYYAGFSRRVARWSWAATAVRYTYPGLTYDYDYNELSVTAGFRDRVFFTTAYIDELLGRDASALYSEIGTALPLPHGVELGATIGRLTSSDRRLEYSHWNLGFSKTLARRIGVDLRYYDGNRYVPTPLAAASTDAWVLSASYGFRSK